MTPQRPGDSALPEFEIDVGHGRAILQLRPSMFFGWLQADSLALAVPEVQFPLDIRSGMGQFQRQRCQLTSAAFSIDEQGLTIFTGARASLLQRVGFDNVEVRLLEGTAGLVGSARLGESIAELTACVFAEPEGRIVRLWLAEPSLLGFLPRPAPVVAHDLMCVLLGAVPADENTADDVARPIAVGLGQFLVPPLDLLASRVLAPAGWRLPDASRVQIAEAVIGGGRVELRYGPNLEIGAQCETPAAGTSARDAHERFRVSDDMLLRGQLDGAAAGYRRDLVRYPDEAEFLSRRLLAVLCARRTTLREASEFAHQTLERWPGFVAARLALATVATANDRPDTAAEEFIRVAELADATGDADRAVCAAVCAARLLRDRDPARAAQLYQRVVARRPGHPEAVQALAEGHRKAQRWPELALLLEERAPLTRDRAARARLHLELAEIYTNHLGDPLRARGELEQATRVEPDNLRAWDALTSMLALLDDLPAAIAAGERLRALFLARRDPVGEARAWARLGSLCERSGDLRAAREMFGRSLALVPSESLVLEPAAAVAVQLGLLDEAADAYQLLAESTSAGHEVRQRAIGELVRIHTRCGDLERARFCLDLLSDDPDPETLVAVAALEESAGDLDQAAARLAAASARLEGTRACQVETTLARLLFRLGRADDARKTLERAFAADPGSALADAAARRLADEARAAGDVGAEVRWMDAFLREETAGDDAARFRRADLAFATGDAATARSWLERIPRAAFPGAEQLYADVLGALGDAAGKAHLLQTLAGSAPSAAVRAELLAGAAMALVDAGETRAAMACARAAAEADPDSRSARRAVADTAWHGRAWDEVVAIYPLWLEVVTGAERVTALSRLGTALERVGQLREAFDCYQSAIESAEDGSTLLADSWRRLASLCEQLGDYRAAADAYATAAVDPRLHQTPERRAELHARAAEILSRFLGKADAAILEAERALAVDPENAAALATLESIAAETGDNRAVLASLRRQFSTASSRERQLWLAQRIETVAALAPTAMADPALAAAADPACLAEAERIRFLLLEIGDAEAAMAAWKTAKEAWPGSALLVEVKREIDGEFDRAAHMASTEVSLGGDGPVYSARLRASVDELHEARKNRPYDANVLSPLAGLYREARDWKAAIGAMTDLLATTGNLKARAELLYRMGEIYRIQLGDRESAGDHYLKAMDLDPGHLPALRRTLEYYWFRGELAELAEIGDELCRAAPREFADTEPPLLACLALASALTGDSSRATSAAAALGPGGDEAVVVAVTLASPDLSIHELNEALRLVCVGAGLSLARVRRLLFGHGLSSPRFRALAKLLSE